MKTVKKENIAGVAEVAAFAGVERATVHAWRHRHEDFPQPVAELACGSVFDLNEVERWLAKPRPTGRPKS